MLLIPVTDGLIMKRRYLLGAMFTIMLGLGVIYASPWGLIARHEGRLGKFQIVLLPALRQHLMDTGQYDRDMFAPDGVGSYALPYSDDVVRRSVDSSTSWTVIEDFRFVIVTESKPENDPVLCVWYDKFSGRYSRLIIHPWK